MAHAKTPRALTGNSLEAALTQLLGPPPGVRGDLASPWPGSTDDASPLVYAGAACRSHRSRRILLDGEWWNEPGPPLLARLRNETESPNPSDESWVALLPRASTGYVVATDAGQPGALNAQLASSLAPFAFTFHPMLPARPVGLSDILRLSLTPARRDLAIVLLAGLAAALVGLLTPVATGRIIDAALPSANLPLALRLIAGLACAGLALVAVNMLRAVAAVRAESRTTVTLQAALLDRVVSAPAQFFRRFASGDLALRLGAVSSVQRGVTEAAVGIAVSVSFLVANLALMLGYSPTLTGAAAAVAGAAAILAAGIGIARIRVARRAETAEGRLSAATVEVFAGIAKLRAAAAESRAHAHWLRHYAEWRAHDRGLASLANLESALLAVLQPAAVALVLWLAFQLSASPAARALPLGDYVAFQAAMFALLGGIAGLVGTMLDLATLAPAWERARPLLNITPESGGAGRVRHTPQGGVQLRGVSFAYPGGPEVLADIDLEIRPGEFVALVGASGSGKSTLVRLILGFEAPTQGFVSHDGIDLAMLDPRHLRAGIGTVLQGGRLWAGDLLSNIGGPARITADEAWEAIRAAGLAADVEAMPMGLYTLVGEGVATLSGGQRQRVLIARALALKPKLLLLDEATSALDNVSQSQVLASLEKLAATRVVVAHRLSTVRHADRIVVIERGRIAQQGTFQELAEAPGPFAAMLARQRA